MNGSWYKLIVSGILICLFCIMQSSASIAAGGDGLQVYQKNMHLSAERKQKLARDIDRYRNADNIWDTMRSEFTLPHYEDNPRVQEMIDYYMNNQDELYQSASRAAPYLYYILQQARERHLPAEVALLPFFESTYDPYAYSSAGAAGIWQLMPATASGEGIKQNSWYDGRRDVVASTKAALNHLAYLGNFFDGNWLLAIAAYDTGEGSILSAIRRNERDGDNTEYWNLPLAQETRSYIPKLMALAIIISNPKKYPVQLPYVRNAPYLAQVDVGSQINLKEAAKLAGLSFKELQQLNPGFNHGATGPHGPYKLILPIENVEQFTENLSGSNENDDPVSFIQHKLKHGETLASLADKYNTSIDMIKEMNPDIKDHVKPGTNLVIPKEKTGSKTVITTNSGQQVVIADKTDPSLASSDGKETADTASAPKEESTHATTTVAANNTNNALNLNIHGHYALQPGDTLYMVREGDNIEKIARHFHTNSESLRTANQIGERTVLAVGSELVIPTHNSKHHSTTTYQLEPGDTIYMVRKSDTIEKIASRYHTTPEALRVVNLLADNQVKAGDRLVIPTHA